MECHRSHPLAGARGAEPEDQGSITVPVLWDKQERTIVNNESAEILRMLNSEFNAHSRAPGLDLYPPELREAIDATNDWKLTEADVRLFTTLIRFDTAYHTRYKCNHRQIAQYPAIHRYLARLYHMPGVRQTVNLEHIRFHYYHSHRHINPTGIVPRGSDVLRLLEQADA